MAYDSVVDSAVLDGAMTATANAIREKTGISEQIAWDRTNGFKDSVDEVYEAGKKSEWDKFWDAYQNYGNRTNYAFAFSGVGWTTENLKPKYNIVATNYNLAFRDFPIAFNISDFFFEQGIMLDFSKCTVFSEMLLFSKINGIGIVDTRSANNINYAFSNATALETIRLLILKDDGSQSLSSSFNNCLSLKNITIQGIIGADVSFSASTLLTKDSITNIVNALSTTTTGKTLTLSKTAVDNAFGGSTSAEWLALRETRSNWTIALA